LLRIRNLTGCALLVILAVAATAPGTGAQYPLAQSSTLLAFDGYHDYQATVAFMDHYARTYPDIVEKFSIGKSYLGTDVQGLIITNKKTGPHTEKSAYWADGNRHSGEVTGGEAVLYTIKYLCENYGQDPVVTKIVDTKAAYLVPKMNPDGSDVYLHTPGTLRSTVRPYDQDGDGKADEDPAEDLDGDGYSRQMRWVDPNGQYVLDPEQPNGMRRRTDQDKGPFYSMGSEGIDNDGDGRVNEDGIGGLDLHRNFPFNWRPMSDDEATDRGVTQGGAGEYPLSEPETRNIVVFLLRHPNVSTVETYDTSVPMLLRPPSMGDDRLMFPTDEAWYLEYDRVGSQITGYTRTGNVYRDYGGGSPLFGHSPDWGYFAFGSIWYGDELWTGGRVDYDGDGQYSPEERQRFNDSLSPPYSNQPWTKAHHPVLGEVEVGGSNSKFPGQNPPPALLEAEIKKNVLWAVRKMEWMPLMRVAETKVEKVAGQENVFRVSGYFVNEGRLPTALEIAKQIHIVQEDFGEIAVPEGMSLVDASGQPLRGGFGRGGRGGGGGGRGGMFGMEQPQGPAPAVRSNRVTMGWLDGSMDESYAPLRRVTWYVKVDGATRNRVLTVTGGSTRGGMHRVEVTLPR
jgi:hypothetical protein